MRTYSKDTIRYLQEAGIKPVGYITNAGKSQDLVIHSCKDKTFGFLGYSMTKDEHNLIVNEYAYCTDEDNIIEEIQHLGNHPYIGRSGRVPGTRELILTKTPFIIPYQVTKDMLVILRVYHMARKWPDQFD